MLFLHALSMHMLPEYRPNDTEDRCFCVLLELKLVSFPNRRRTLPTGEAVPKKIRQVTSDKKGQAIEKAK